MKKIALIGFLVGSLSSTLWAVPEPVGIVNLDGYGNSDATGLRANRTRGDYQEQRTLASDDKLFFIYGYGYNGTSMVTTPRASITFNASEGWTTTANGTYISFLTTPATTVTQSEALRINGKNITFSRMKVDTSASYTLGTGTSTTPTTSFGLFTSTGGAINVTATPTLTTSTFTNGTEFEIFSTTATITLNDNDGVAGTLLELGASTRALGVGDGVRLRYYNGKWYEIAFFNN